MVDDSQDNSFLLEKVFVFDSSSDDTTDSSHYETSTNSTTCDWDVISDVSSVFSFTGSNSEKQKRRISYKSALLSSIKEQTKAERLEDTFVLVTRTRRLSNPGARLEKRDGIQKKCYDQEEEMYWEEKPFSDKLRKKYDRRGKRQGLIGHTGRNMGRNRGYSFGSFQLGVERVLPKRSRIDLWRGYQHVTTAVEEYLGREPVGWYPYTENRRLLNHSQQWDELPDILEAESCVPPLTTFIRFGCSGFRRATLYKLKAKTLEKIDSIAPHEIDNHIYFVPIRSSPSSKRFIPKKIFATVDREIPFQVKDNELVWQLCHKSRMSTRIPRNAIPRIHGLDYWDVSDKTSSNTLDIDLGHSQIVTAISTQGGSPPTRLYPNTVRELNNSWRVEDELFDEPYRGRYWRVFHPERRGWKGHQWVRSYRVFSRADGGRNWNPLGEFSGNVDTTTVRTHLLNGSVDGGIKCRYLRFVPTACENGGALRIQVYGREIKGQPRSKPRPEHTDSIQQDEQTVEYRLYHQSPLKHKEGQTTDAFAYAYNYYYDQKLLSKRRRELQKQAANEIEDNL